MTAPYPGTQFTYIRAICFDTNVDPVQQLKSVTGQLYDPTDTAYASPLTVTLISVGSAVTSITSNANGILPDFYLDGYPSLVFKSASNVFALECTADAAARAADAAAASATAAQEALASGGVIGGTARLIAGPTLPSLPIGTEYVWNKTDGSGSLLDIVSGVA